VGTAAIDGSLPLAPGAAALSGRSAGLPRASVRLTGHGRVPGDGVSGKYGAAPVRAG
jgi:hypothetical protein